jgi:5-methylcytosine-specific restriction endonuclease McrA
MEEILLKKKCFRCKVIKDANEFGKEKRNNDGLQSYCKECMNEYSRDWDKKNPEKRRIISKKWRSANPELGIRLAREWNLSHVERKREINRNWNKNHPKQVRMMEKNRDYRERNAPGKGITEREWNQLKEDCDYRCVYCGKKTTLELDHVIPISKGGAHEILNAVPACRSCNGKKSNKSLLLFLYEMYSEKEQK